MTDSVRRYDCRENFEDPTFRKAFENWLHERGAEVLVPTNEYELIRFKANGVVSIVYRRKREQVTFTGEAERAFEDFRTGGAWRAEIKRFVRQPNSVSKRKLIKQQGSVCFFCGEEFPADELTVEHMVARAQGGPDHLANKVLACEPCNKKAHNLSVYDKVLLRERTHTRARYVEVKNVMDAVLGEESIEG